MSTASDVVVECSGSRGNHPLTTRVTTCHDLPRASWDKPSAEKACTNLCFSALVIFTLCFSCRLSSLQLRSVDIPSHSSLLGHYDSHTEKRLPEVWRRDKGHISAYITLHSNSSLTSCLNRLGGTGNRPCVASACNKASEWAGIIIHWCVSCSCL